MHLPVQGCKLAVPPSIYLGLPLDALLNSLAMWDELEDRLKDWSLTEKPIYLQRGEGLL